MQFVLNLPSTADQWDLSRQPELDDSGSTTFGGQIKEADLLCGLTEAPKPMIPPCSPCQSSGDAAATER